MPMDRPIPAFYCCYLLRSTVRHGSVYIGSTPNPARRLSQHNGVIKGGAARTSRQGLRPWEMTCIVVGFPSHIAALQFEWAWQNPHVTLHIPPELRIQHATAKKRSGHPKRPKLTISSLLSNLHLLLRVPSFTRWPLELNFFSEDVYKVWQNVCGGSLDMLPGYLKVKTDFPVEKSLIIQSEVDKTSGKPLHGIDRLSIDYSNQKAQIEKAKTIIDFEQERSCPICRVDLEHGQGIYTICPNSECKTVTHMTCLSNYFLQNDEESMLPVEGSCPICHHKTRWVDIVKELSLRIRGEKEMKKLLKGKKKRASKILSRASSHAPTESSEEQDEEMNGCEDHSELIPSGGYDTTSTINCLDSSRASSPIHL
ncbi:Structure-specific endonuclease subunit [Podosphaera aphanis]|nr:Structure-specific endonuclease subunit [Podosphaera aphanis]